MGWDGGDGVDGMGRISESGRRGPFNNLPRRRSVRRQCNGGRAVGSEVVWLVVVV